MNAAPLTSFTDFALKAPMAAPKETGKEEDSLIGAPTLCSAKIGLAHLEKEAIEDAIAGELAAGT